ncbi:MAG: hypothetical protein ACRCVN_06155 [Spirochaetia bacterium]
MHKSTINLTEYAEQLYKNKKGLCILTLRELMSNAYHALLINIDNKKEPKISVTIDWDNKKFIIEDNGCGFDSSDREALTCLASPNQKKKDAQLPSKGQGRAILAYVGDSTTFNTVSKDDESISKKFTFNYPLTQQPELFVQEDGQLTNEPSGTHVEVKIKNINKIWTTFNSAYNNFAKIKEFFEREFFYFFVSLENLSLSITSKSVNEEQSGYSMITKRNYEKISFEVTFTEDKLSENDDAENKTNIDTYIIREEIKGSIETILIGHHIPAECKDIKYDRHFNQCKFRVYIFSEYFSEKVNLEGSIIELNENESKKINEALVKNLDNFFASQINEQKKTNIEAHSEASRELIAFHDFLPPEGEITGHHSVNAKDFQKIAFEEYSKASIAYLTNDDQEDTRIIKSALHMYIIHRDRVLKKLGELLHRNNDDGTPKTSLESDMHELLFKRASSTNTTNNKDLYYRHNLWLLDDKFSYFSEAESTKTGEKKSDIYLYLDEPSEPNEVVIIELKRPVGPSNKDGHNPKKMIDQVREYATAFYTKKRGINGVDIETENCSFWGYIIASREDINAAAIENGNTVSIPFAPNSKSISIGLLGDASGKNIHIELWVYSDLEKIAKKRNKAFMNFLNTSISNQNSITH